MEDFYFYACIVALVILILMLTMVGIIISYGQGAQLLPLTAAKCPDYWTPSGDYCLYPPSLNGTNRGSADFINGINNYPADDDTTNLIVLNTKTVNKTGTLNTTPPTLANIKSKDGVGTEGQLYIRMNNNDASWNSADFYSGTFAGLTPRCAKRQWANLNGIVWDGVTNYNGCA